MNMTIDREPALGHADIKHQNNHTNTQSLCMIHTKELPTSKEPLLQHADGNLNMTMSKEPPLWHANNDV